MAVPRHKLASGRSRDRAVAVARAAAQLTALAVVIEVVFDHLALTVAFLALMLTAAAWTTDSRWGHPAGGRSRAALAIGLGAGLVLAAVLATPVFDRTPRYVLPLAGIVIGGSMTAASLAGRRVRDDVANQLHIIEAQLSLGISARRALAPVVSRAVVNALIPALDQTKNVGVITLPGAFVGTLLSGASPATAAAIQLTVLFMLLGAETVAATAAGLLIARAHVTPGERVVPLDRQQEAHRCRAR